MDAEAQKLDLPNKPPRCFTMTRDGLFVGLLVVEAFILCAETFQWFSFDKNPVRTARLAIGIAVAAVAALFFSVVLVRRFQRRRWYQYSYVGPCQALSC